MTIDDRDNIFSPHWPVADECEKPGRASGVGARILTNSATLSLDDWACQATGSTNARDTRVASERRPIGGREFCGRAPGRNAKCKMQNREMDDRSAAERLNARDRR